MDNQVNTTIIPKQEAPQSVTPVAENKLIVGIIPMRDRLFLNMAWSFIKPYVVELANSSLGEYDESRVYLEILDGNSTLFMFYIDDTPNLTQSNFQKVFITKHLGTTTPERNFVGFVVVRYDINAKSMHTWQLYVKEEYRNNKQISEMGIKFLEGHALDIGLTYSTFAASRPAIGALARNMGYSETFTIYRKQIKK